MNFFNATSLWSTWLSLRAGLSKPVLGPFTVQFDTFAARPVFTRNAWFGGRAGNLQQDQAVSLACLSLSLERFPLPWSQLQPNHFPFRGSGKEPAGSLLPSSACSRSWPNICSDLPGFHMRGAQPGQVLSLSGRGLNLSPCSFSMLLREVWK